MKVAASKNYFIQNSPQILPLMEKVITAQLAKMESIANSADKKTADPKTLEALKNAKAALIAKLNALNKNGEIVSPAVVEKNPIMSIESQVDGILQVNEQVIEMSFSFLIAPNQFARQILEFSIHLSSLAESVPLMALAQNAMYSSMTKYGEQMAKAQNNEILKQLGQTTGQIVTTQALETSYGIIMKNVEFLSMLTSMTNPEYAR